jgi:chemotaxis protein CheC
VSSGFWDSLDTDQIDALQEIGNIGSGHSANALADLLNRRIDMSLPRYSLLSPDEFSKVDWTQFKENTTVAVSICNMTGDLEGQILVVLDEIAINFLLKIINPSADEINFSNLGALDKSIILEVGSILSLHYLTAINTFLVTKSFPETPFMVIDASEKILATITQHMKENVEKILLVECDIFTTDVKLKPIIIFSPLPTTIERTLNAMFGL